MTFNLNSLVETSIFTTAADDLLISVYDTTPPPPTSPEKLDLDFDVELLLIAVTSSSTDDVTALRSVSDSERRAILQEAGDAFTTTTVCFQCPLPDTHAHTVRAESESGMSNYVSGS